MYQSQLKTTHLRRTRLETGRADEWPGAATSGSRRRRGPWVMVGVVVVAALVGGLILVFDSGGSTMPRPLVAPGGLDVLPFPGTQDASPQSQISFPTLRPSQLRAVTVQGSRTGVHSGQLSALPDDRGTAFVPNSAFTAGEQVSIRAALISPGVGTASGSPNATEISLTFTVATPPASSSAPATSSTAKPPPTQSFHSSSLRPPVVTVATPDADPSSGDVFVDVANGSQNGPMILDSQGRLVWFDPRPAGSAHLTGPGECWPPQWPSAAEPAATVPTARSGLWPDGRGGCAADAGAGRS